MGKKGSEEDKNLRRMKTIGKDVVKADYKNVDTSFYERNIKPFLDKMNKKQKILQKGVAIPFCGAIIMTIVHCDPD